MSLLTKTELENQLDFSISQIKKGSEIYRYGLFPRNDDGRSDVGYVYRARDISGWENGFWAGLVLLAYEMTGDKKLLDVNADHVKSFYERVINNYSLDHHDIGFEYSLSCVSSYKVTGNELARKAALMAADKLCERYTPVGKFIKPWSTMDDPVEHRIIVDTYLNLPLLFWASEESGDSKYREIALNHLDTTVDVLVRPDGCAYHTYMMEYKYGNPIRPKVDQGYADDSVWSRGQAWVVYGMALAYSYTQNKHLADVQMNATKQFIERLPADNIPAWDMVFTDTRTLKDTSAAVIATCGMLEMNKLINHPDSDMWNEKVHDILRELDKNHTTKTEKLDTTAILTHATSSVPHDYGLNVSLIYADYYYMETLVRLLKPDWNRYW